MKKEKRVVVAGHICLDITPMFPPSEVKDIRKALPPGNLRTVKGVNIHTGGAVANTGLAFKKLGIDARLMGKIGKDEFGELVLNCLRKYDAEESIIIAEDTDTSYTIVLAIPGIDRIFLHDTGANDNFSFEDLHFDEIEKASLFHFGYPTIMKKIYKNNGAELIRIFKKVKELGVATALDLSSINPQSEVATMDWCGILEGTLPFVDFFVPSAEELCFMIDKERYQEWRAIAGDKDITEVISFEDVKPLGDKAIGFGAKVVLIKCGAKGLYYQTAPEQNIQKLCENLDMSLKAWANKEGFEASYVPRKVVSATGAGDACIAAFLASILIGKTATETMRLAAAEGACCVEAYDSLSGLKSLAELEQQIAQGWKKSSHKEIK